jgi:hypothetical protein
MDLSEYTEGKQALKVALDKLLGCEIKLKTSDGRVVAQAGITAISGEEPKALLKACVELVAALGGNIQALVEGRQESIKATLGICGAEQYLPGEHPKLCAFRPEHIPATHSWER